MSSGQNLNSFTLQCKNLFVLTWTKALFVGFSTFLVWTLSLPVQASPKSEVTLEQTQARPAEKPTSSLLKKLEADLKANPKNRPALDALAQEYFNRADYDLCTKLLWKHIDTLDRKEMILLSKAHLQKKEYSEAIRMTQMLISKNEKDEEAHTLMGQAHLIAGREKEALNSFKTATEINGSYQPAYDGLIAVYEKRSNLYELRIIYQDMIEKLGERPEFLTKLCDINTTDALNDPAAEFCRKAIQKSESTPENHVNLGLVHKNLGDLVKAQEKLKTTAERFTQSLYAQITYARFAEEKSDFIESFRFYSNCLRIAPDNEQCLVGHGVTGAQIQKLDEAYQSLKKACSKDRKNAVAVRKIVILLKGAKKNDWVRKFESLSEKCMLQ